MYDYLIVGSGLTGSVLARELTNADKKVLVIDKRDHIGGNCYSEVINSLPTCKYGGHIFHTNSDYIWSYINRFTRFNQYNHKVLVNYENNIFSFPINMMTFYQLWGTKYPQDARDALLFRRKKYNHEPRNFEEKALNLVGEEIYYIFFYGYTKKQWNTDPKDLPASLLNRIPIRFSYDNSYYSDTYQGIPEFGYTAIFENLLNGIRVELGQDYLLNRDYYNSKVKRIIYTGEIDKFYDYYFGKLGYRSLLFDYKDTFKNLGCATMNFTSEKIDWTRVVNFGYFYGDETSNNIMMEYPSDTGEPYYPINTEDNQLLYKKYKELDNNIIFCGRLGAYKYMDMDQAIGHALKIGKDILNATI